MLSLTGMSHEQFANLMSGLNYNVVKSFKTKNVNQNTTKAEDVVIQDHDNKEEEVVYTFKFEQRESKRSISKNFDETSNYYKPKEIKMCLSPGSSCGNEFSGSDNGSC